MELRLFKIEIKSFRSSLESNFLKYLKPIYPTNNKNKVVLIKLIIFTTADPIQDLLLTPSDWIKSGLPKFDTISYTVPQLISNSLYKSNDIPTYLSVTSLNKLKKLNRNKNTKNIKNDFLLNIN